MPSNITHNQIKSKTWSFGESEHVLLTVERTTDGPSEASKPVLSVTLDLEYDYFYLVDSDGVIKVEKLQQLNSTDSQHTLCPDLKKALEINPKTSRMFIQDQFIAEQNALNLTFRIKT